MDSLINLSKVTKSKPKNIYKKNKVIIMRIKINLKTLVGISILLVSLPVAIVLAQITGQDFATGSTPLNVTVVQFVSITPSAGITRGILFGTVRANSFGNPAENDTTGPGGGTEYFLTVDSSTSSNINFFDRTSPDLTCTGGTCTDFNRASKTSATGPWSANYTIGTEWKKIAGTECDNIAPGSSCYIQYFLNVSAGVLSGNYQTTYYFCGNSTAGTATCS